MFRNQDDQDLKIVFAGPMGAGKTTAIRAISESPTVGTDVASVSDGGTKATTTVAFDYGQLPLGDGLWLRLYGAPGQERFRHMWEIICNGALGTIVLADARSPDCAAQTRQYVDEFVELSRRSDGAVAVGLGWTGQPGALSVDTLRDSLLAAGHAPPVLAVDVRQRADVARLVDTILTQLEAR